MLLFAENIAYLLVILKNCFKRHILDVKFTLPVYNS